MTSTHIERYAELGAIISRLKANLRGEPNLDVQKHILSQLQEAIYERNELWDAIEFRVPEMI